MPDLSAYKVDLDTPQPNGGRGESPRAAFTKYNGALDALENSVELDSNGQVPMAQLPLRDHGQCRLVHVSTDEVRLIPCNGNGIVINGKQCRIPPAGVSLARSIVPSDTVAYVVALDPGDGSIQLSINGVNEVHGRDANGVEVMTSNPALTLVGMVYNHPTNGFQWSPEARYVASWFNRRPVALVATIDAITTSGSWVPLPGGISLLDWTGDALSVTATGVLTNTSSNNSAWMALSVEGTNFGGGYGINLAPSIGFTTASLSVTTPYQLQSDRLIHFGINATVSNGVSVNYLQQISTIAYI